MSLYDVGVVCSIIHGIILLLGYLAYTNVSSSLRLIASKSFRMFFTFAHFFTPTFLLCSTVACWMAVIHRSQTLAVVFLCLPVGFAIACVLVYMCSNLEERGPTNHEILHGKTQEYYSSYVSHVDFANDLIARTDEFRAQHPDHELEHSPYLRRRLASMGVVASHEAHGQERSLSAQEYHLQQLEAQQQQQQQYQQHMQQLHQQQR